jgi:hypothetical protein
MHLKIRIVATSDIDYISMPVVTIQHPSLLMNSNQCPSLLVKAHRYCG